MQHCMHLNQIMQLKQENGGMNVIFVLFTLEMSPRRLIQNAATDIYISKNGLCTFKKYFFSELQKK